MAHPGEMLHRLSRRTAWDRTPAEFVSTLDRARAQWPVLLDLTTTNPTACGFDYDASAITAPLSSAAALRYQPASIGLPAAREAVSVYYAGHQASVPPEQIVLTASTSEAYSHLFRLLCDPGDEVLIAQPGYPLFDYLAALADVRLRPYPLFYDHGWCIDVAALEHAVTPRTCALIVVHPANPTGHMTAVEERLALYELCARHGLSLIVDEVFLDYPHAPSGCITSFAAGTPPPVPTFVLSGMSKVAALPQMKLAWVAVLGPVPLRNEALERLEMIADTFLSVSTPAQLALPAWLANAPAIQQQILARIRVNLRQLAAAGLTPLGLDAGWSGIVRLPRVFAERTAAESLLTLGIVTHPAEIYGLDEPSRVVLSLIVPEGVLREAVNRLNFAGWAASSGPDALA